MRAFFCFFSAGSYKAHHEKAINIAFIFHTPTITGTLRNHGKTAIYTASYHARICNELEQ